MNYAEIDRIARRIFFAAYLAEAVLVLAACLLAYLLTACGGPTETVASYEACARVASAAKARGCAGVVDCFALADQSEVIASAVASCEAALSRADLSAWSSCPSVGDLERAYAGCAAMERAL
jgi:hypothetical protein